MRSATFRNIALGVLALAASYHLGARSAGAQAPGNPVVAAAAIGQTGYIAVFTANGDVYGTGGGTTINFPTNTWTGRGNIFSGSGPVPVQRETFGALKARYRATPGGAQPGAAQPTTQDR